jgi:hypothetical protein
MTPISSDPPGSVASILAQKTDLVVGSTLGITRRIRAGDTAAVHKSMEGELVVRSSAQRPLCHCRHGGGRGTGRDMFRFGNQAA